MQGRNCACLDVEVSQLEQQRENKLCNGGNFDRKLFTNKDFQRLESLIHKEYAIKFRTEEPEKYYYEGELVERGTVDTLNYNATLFEVGFGYKTETDEYMSLFYFKSCGNINCQLVEDELDYNTPPRSYYINGVTVYNDGGQKNPDIIYGYNKINDKIPTRYLNTNYIEEYKAIELKRQNDLEQYGTIKWVSYLKSNGLELKYVRGLNEKIYNDVVVVSCGKPLTPNMQSLFDNYVVMVKYIKDKYGDDDEGNSFDEYTQYTRNILQMGMLFSQPDEAKPVEAKPVEVKPLSKLNRPTKPSLNSFQEGLIKEYIKDKTLKYNTACVIMDYLKIGLSSYAKLDYRTEDIDYYYKSKVSGKHIDSLTINDVKVGDCWNSLTKEAKIDYLKKLLPTNTKHTYNCYKVETINKYKENSVKDIVEQRFDEYKEGTSYRYCERALTNEYEQNKRIKEQDRVEEQKQKRKEAAIKRNNEFKNNSSIKVLAGCIEINENGNKRIVNREVYDKFVNESLVIYKIKTYNLFYPEYKGLTFTNYMNDKRLSNKSLEDIKTKQSIGFEKSYPAYGAKATEFINSTIIRYCGK